MESNIFKPVLNLNNDENDSFYPLVQSVIGQKLTASHQNEQAAKMIDGWAKLKYKLNNAIKRVFWELIQNA